MTDTVLNLRFACRRRTAASWASINEVLLLAEIGLERDTGKFKFGDGVTAWNSLPYYGGTLWQPLHAFLTQIAGLGNPGADRLLHWDVTTGQFQWLIIGSGLTISSSGALEASGGGGGSTLIASDTLGAAGTTLTIATGSFNLSTSKRLRVRISGKDASASDAGYIAMYLNTDTTATNYYTQLGVFQGNTASAARSNDSSLVYQYNGASFEMECILKLDQDGKCRITADGEAAGGAASTIYRNGIYYQTAANITGLSIVAPANLATGSTVEVWST